MCNSDWKRGPRGVQNQPHDGKNAFGLQEATDAAVFAEALKTSNEVTGEKAYDIIVKANTQLNKNKVPKADRYIVINAEVLEDLQLDSRFTEHYTILENGIMEGAKINGVQLVFSEELNGGSYAIVASQIL